MVANKKTNTKTMDVKSAGSTTPDSTARPIIVSNRSMIQDPMLQAEQSSQDLPTSPLLTAHPTDTGKAVVEPDVKPAEKPEEPSHSEATTSAPLIKQDTKPDNKTALKQKTTDSSQGKNVVTPLNPTNGQDEPKEPEEPEESDIDADKKLAKPVKANEAPAAEPQAPIPTSSDESKGEQSSEEKADDAEPAEDASEDEDSEAKQKAEEEELEAAEKERIEHLKALIDNKTYFVETGHQGGKGAGWLAVFVLLVAGAGIAYMVVMSGK